MKNSLSVMAAGIVLATVSGPALADKNTDKIVRNTGAMVKYLKDLSASSGQLAKRIDKLEKKLTYGPIDGGSMRANLTSVHDLPQQMFMDGRPVDQHFGQMGPQGVIVWMGNGSRIRKLTHYLSWYCGSFGKQYKAMYSSQMGIVKNTGCNDYTPGGQPWCYLKDMFDKPVTMPVRVDKVMCEFKVNKAPAE